MQDGNRLLGHLLDRAAASRAVSGNLYLGRAADSVCSPLPPLWARPLVGEGSTPSVRHVWASHSPEHAVAMIDVIW
jgi:hypothetical protein